jgi:hypothetical protein
MDIKRKTYDVRPGKNVYFSTYPPTTLIHLSHRFTRASKPAPQKPLDCCLSHFRTSVSTSSPSARCLPPMWFLSGPDRWKSLRSSPSCEADVQEVPSLVPDFSPGLLGLYVVSQCHEAVLLLPVGLDVFCELHPEAST